MRFLPNFFNQTACSTIVLCTVLLGGVLAPNCQADGPKGKKKKQGTTFTFYKVITTEDGGTAFLDKNAYWVGQGTFEGSDTLYDLKVTLNEKNKFPGYGENGEFVGMGVINPTKMIYEISLNGNPVCKINFKGWASLRPLAMGQDGTFFLHDGKVSPKNGWPGALACPPKPSPEGFSFTHTFDDSNIQMYGAIKSKWAGLQPNRCNRNILEPSMGPKRVEGVIVFP